MIKSLLRFCGIVEDEMKLDQFDPIYGLSKRSLDEWLSRNSAIKKKYEADLLTRLRRGWSARDKRISGV